MLGHIGLNVPDLDAARRYYGAVIRWSGSRTTGLQQLAFMVPTRSAVTAAHTAVAAMATQFGGRVLHPPQVFPQYPQPYFATYWLDPWGFMLEAVCHHDRD